MTIMTKIIFVGGSSEKKIDCYTNEMFYEDGWVIHNSKDFYQMV